MSCRAPHAGAGLQPRVSIWYADLSVWSAHRDLLLRTLGRDERARAERFVRPLDRERFVVTRGLLRMLLGCCMGVPPQALAFAAGVNGKPRLADIWPQPMSFSSSHSRGLMMFGVTRGQSVGVDIEYVRSGFDVLVFAERFLAADELEALRAVPAARRAAAFFACWTRKEAVIKARGAALLTAVGEISVSVAPDREPRLLAWLRRNERVSSWSLHDVPVPSGFRASAAVPAPGVAFDDLGALCPAHLLAPAGDGPLCSLDAWAQEY